ncbi:MAG: hypothetical protein M1817_006325 [Caeruleum heppii]|nr:MAG: hypothetical protein M1817_006325 [Caeruleum heppii]
MPTIDCCCGQQDCLVLLHNSTALDGLERSVQTAARAGQALLVRHEAYMVDAEQERQRMNLIIEQLEADKRTMEMENAKTLQENSELLKQLEDLNVSVADSDVHIRALTATLQSTQQELSRLTALAARTAKLELQLATLEEEQARLHQSLVISQEDERSAVQRWRQAERTLAGLHEQIERIEAETKAEREKHIEVVGRLERRRAVEKELESAAGRLKGAAAATTLGKTSNGSNAVSHFVKDLLQDNANLHLGIVEIRDLLHSSNEEVELLRHQLMLHQPVALSGLDGNYASSLSEELDPVSVRMPSQELHVHHHYHPSERQKEKLPAKRPRKKRNAITSTLFSPPTLIQPPLQHSESVGPNLPQLMDVNDEARSSRRSFAAPTAFQPTTSFNSLDSAIEEDRDLDVDGTSLCIEQPAEVVLPIGPATSSESPDPSEDTVEPDACMPALQRSVSHESLLSVSGMDIHTLRSRPSQVTLIEHKSSSSHLLPYPATHGSNPTAALTRTAAVVTAASTATAVARPPLARRPYDSSSYNRSLLRGSGNSSEEPVGRKGAGFGNWVWGRWSSGSSSAGAAPSSASASMRRNRSKVTDASAIESGLPPIFERPPGVNQAGPIKGLKPPRKVMTDVTVAVRVEDVEWDGLRAALAE